MSISLFDSTYKTVDDLNKSSVLASPVVVNGSEAAEPM